MVELLLKTTLENILLQRIAGKGKKSEKEALEDSLKDLLATIGSFQFYSGRTKVDQNIASLNYMNRVFIESIETTV